VDERRGERGREEGREGNIKKTNTHTRAEDNLLLIKFSPEFELSILERCTFNKQKRASSIETST